MLQEAPSCSQNELSISSIDAPQRLSTDKGFLQLGWCPHQVQRLQKVYTPETLSHLSTLDRRGFRPNNHNACAEAPRCIANNVNLSNYDTAHTPSCSGSCPAIAVDYKTIVSIIREGGVPLVSIHVDPTSTPEIPVVHLSLTPRTPSTRYTVLSHVWFDGLGNPSANALPSCQIMRISSQLNSLPRDHESGVVHMGALEMDWSRQSFVLHPERQPPMFWMDTLCIPVGENEQELRSVAINQMASIYAAAVQELVLDAELLQCELGPSMAVEVLARMACSAWMTRSWTLQEGVLARECVFQFKDRAIDPVHEWCLHGPRFTNRSAAQEVVFPGPEDEMRWAVYRELYNNFWDTLHQDWKSSFRRDPPTPPAHRSRDGSVIRAGALGGSQAVGKVHTLPVAQGLSRRDKSGLDSKDHFTMQLKEEHRVKQLVDTWNELAHRSTTMPEDLHVIIANLLDFNADRVMQMPTREARMRSIILSFTLLPMSLFWADGPKLGDDDGSEGGCNRWIPVEPCKSELTMTPVMRVTEQWLKLDFELGADLDVPQAQVLLIEPLRLPLETAFMFADPQTGVFYDVNFIDNHKERGRISSPIISDKVSHCVIVETTLKSASQLVIRGALFQLLPSGDSAESKEIQLIYCCPVQLRRITETHVSFVHVATARNVPFRTSMAVKYGELLVILPP
jgi:hypothetical protein